MCECKGPKIKSKHIQEGLEGLKAVNTHLSLGQET